MEVSLKEISVEHLETLLYYYYYQTSATRDKVEELRRRKWIELYEAKNQFGRNYVEIMRAARERFSKPENFKMYKAFIEEKAYDASDTLEKFKELRKRGDFLGLLS